jgi:plastocyanin
MRQSKKRIGILFFSLLFLYSFGAADIHAEQTGTITGLVKTPWVKRYQARVYIEKVEGKEFPPTKDKVLMSQKNLVFKPHLLAVLKGTTVDFTNDDNVTHNVFAAPGSAELFNLGTYGVGVTKTVTFNHLGEVTLLCKVHAEMVAYIIVVQNPYYALTEEKTGKFEIRGVPPGTYRLKVWHEKLMDASQEVIVPAGKSVTVDFADLKSR